MSLPRSILNSNNSATVALQNGNHQLAVEMLTSTLRKLNEGLERNSSTAQAGDSKQQVVIVAGAAIELPSVVSNYDSFSFFGHPLTMSSADVEQLSLEHQSQLSAIVLYNIGLIHHVRGLLLGSSKELKKALRFYKFGCTILQDAWESMDFHEIAIALMCLWNNMCHIHSYFFNSEQAQLCIDWMKRLSATQQLEDIDSFSFFRINLLLSENILSISPAA